MYMGRLQGTRTRLAVQNEANIKRLMCIRVHYKAELYEELHHREVHIKAVHLRAVPRKAVQPTMVAAAAVKGRAAAYLSRGHERKVGQPG
jgi:hypothetical protein